MKKILLLLLTLVFSGTNAESLYEILLFEGSTDNFYSYRFAPHAQISPNRFYDYFRQWNGKFNPIEVFDLPIKRDPASVGSKIPVTWQSIRSYQAKVQVQGQDAEYYRKNRKVLDDLYDFLGYKPDAPLDCLKGYMTSFMYYRYVDPSQIQVLQFIELINREKVELIEQLVYLHFCNLLGRIPLSQEKTGITIQKVSYNKPESSPVLLQKEGPLSDLLQSLSMNFKLEISGSMQQNQIILEELLKNTTGLSFSLEEDKLIYEGTFSITFFFRNV